MGHNAQPSWQSDIAHTVCAPTLLQYYINGPVAYCSIVDQPGITVTLHVDALPYISVQGVTIRSFWVYDTQKYLSIGPKLAIRAKYVPQIRNVQI